MATLNEIFKMDKKTNEIGIYNLTPVEAFLINKNLPYGTKLVTEIEYNRKFSFNIINKKKCLLNKKIKRSLREINTNKKQNDDRIKIKKKVKDNYIKLIYKRKSHKNFNYIIRCKCLIFLYQLSKKFELHPIFICNKPSIRDIENNVLKDKYDSFYQFKLSIRKFWLYFFQKKKIDQVKILCKFSEEEFDNIDKLNEYNIIKYLNSLVIDENTSLFQVKSLSPNLTNKSNSVFNNIQEENIPLICPNFNDNSIITNESILKNEKNNLCEKIKYLTSIQLQGIIPLLSEFFTNVNNITDQYFEFDIDLLNKEQTEKVEKYVDKCIEYNNNNNNNNSNIKIINNYDININDNNNSDEKIDKNKKIIVLDTPSSKNSNNINDDITKILEVINEEQNVHNNLNQINNDSNNISNIIKSNKENYKKNNNYNYNNNNNNNDNNISFKENSMLIQNKSLEQSKDITSLFNPLVASDNNLTNSQNISINYYVNKTNSSHLSQKSNQSNYDSESFDFH